MDIVIICNGLGNQMSQYAFFLQKKSINKSTRFMFDRRSAGAHNGYELCRIFGIDFKETFSDKLLFLLFRILEIKKIPVLSKPLIGILNFLGMRIVREKENYDFDESNMNHSRGIRFYFGGWHSEKYFKSNKSQILDAFDFKIDSDDEPVLQTLDHIKRTNSVSIHVRRGDYLSEKNMHTFGAVCTKAYFDAAVNKIESLIDTPHFFIFSNDVAWVKANFKYGNITIIDYNKGNDSWKDLFLMSSCKHNINSNSSFSWWGAWLNLNEDKIVIAPRFFINNLDTKDIYPGDWLQLTDY